jgi:excisionase family DNA binding protein
MIRRASIVSGVMDGCMKVNTSCRSPQQKDIQRWRSGQVFTVMTVIETLRKTTGYIGVKDAADYLGIRKETLLDWVKAGTIPVSQIGNALKMDRADLAEWLETRQRKPVRGAQ